MKPKAFLALLLLAGPALRASAQVCGDGKIEGAEQCDDGNTASGDGCSAACAVEQQCYDAGNTFSFFTWSDSYPGAGDSGAQAVMTDAVSRSRYPGRVIPRFWLAPGDVPYTTAFDSVNSAISGAGYPFSCSASATRFPWFVAVGNHDVDGYGGDPAAEYGFWKNTIGPRLDGQLLGLRNFRVGPVAPDGHDDRTTYSFDYKNAHFVVVNQYHGDPGYPTTNPLACIRPDLYAWIDQDLAATDKPVKFVFGHEPAWSFCSSELDPDPNVNGFRCSEPLDELNPGMRPRPYSTLGAWGQPYGNHYGDSLEDSRCPLIGGVESRRAFWSMLARRGVVAHLVGHTHSYSARLVKGDGTRNADNAASYGKIGQAYNQADGVWEVDSAMAHNSAGALYVLVTVRDNRVTFESYDKLGMTAEPFRRVETWSVDVGPVAPDTTPPVISSTWSLPGALAALAGWTTDEPGDTRIEYGTSTAYGVEVSCPTPTLSHVGLLLGLTPLTTYHFRVKTADFAGNLAVSPDLRLVTAAPDTSSPTVRVTSPADGAALNGFVTVIATAADNGVLVGIQFKLDGADLGAERTALPLSVSWDTTGASNGPHRLTAVARDSWGNSSTSTAVNVTVSNVAGTGRTFYADPTLAAASCATYSPATRACSGGAELAYRDLTEASGVANPGDVVLARGGTWTTRFIPQRSGLAGSPITFRAYTGETPTITLTGGQFLPGLEITDRQHLVLEGLTVTQVPMFGQILRSTDVVLRAMTFLTAQDLGSRGGLRFVDSSFNKVLGSRFEDGNDSLFFENSNNNLVEGNTFVKARHTLLVIACSNYNVVRNNTFHNVLEKEGETFDCEGAINSLYDDTLQVRRLDATKHNVWERNTFQYTPPDNNGDGPFNHLQYAGQDGIIRQNLFYDSNGIGLGLAAYNDEAMNDKHNRVYGNVFYNNYGGGIETGIFPAGADNRMKNNVFYRNTPGPLGWNDGLPGGSQLTHRAAADLRVEANDVMGRAAGEGDVWLDGAARTLAAAQAGYPSLYAANVELEPGFVNAAGHDFHLAAGSALVDRGAFLTTAAAAGGGSVLRVADASWFYDGYGIAGEQGDLIQLAGQTQTARVVAADYASNTLTLSVPLSWTAGQGVSLAYAGAAPDLGAFESGVAAPTGKTPAAPKNLRRTR